MPEYFVNLQIMGISGHWVNKTTFQVPSAKRQLTSFKSWKPLDLWSFRVWQFPLDIKQ
jgi:hypothetical protein